MLVVNKMNAQMNGIIGLMRLSNVNYNLISKFKTHAFNESGKCCNCNASILHIRYIVEVGNVKDDTILSCNEMMIKNLLE